MFFDELAALPAIATRSSCAIFVLPEPESFTLGNLPPNLAKFARLLAPPEGKKSISVEEVRDFTAPAIHKSASDSSSDAPEQLLIITPADALTPAAQSALLKNLEEPRPHYHFALLAREPGRLLPTIHSRASVYFLRPAGDPLSAPVAASENVKTLARALISAPASGLPVIAEKIAKSTSKSTPPRVLAEQVTATAIEILEKSYFATGKVEFLLKLPKFLALADAIAANGHLKLHIVADLI